MNTPIGIVIELFNFINSLGSSLNDKKEYDEYFKKLKKFASDISVSKLDYKGYGKIFILNAISALDVDDMKKKVDEIVKETDEFEYDYLPDGFICNIIESKALVYTGKFDIDCQKLVEKCLEKGILILIVSIPSEYE